MIGPARQVEGMNDVPFLQTQMYFRRSNAKTPAFRAGVSGLGSLTITYFHTGIRTIIGVESFHGPVRDGKGWYRLAMVIRQRGLSRGFAARPIRKKQ